MNFIIPLIVLLIVFYGFFKKIDIYDSFIAGVKEGLEMALKIFPTIFALSLAVQVLLKSHILDYGMSFFKVVFAFFSFPKELLPLAIMRPISGSSSLILMSDVFKNYGVDSYLGRVASLMQGSTDTTIYIIGLYFSSVGIRKIKYSLIVGLLADYLLFLIGFIKRFLAFYFR